MYLIRKYSFVVDKRVYHRLIDFLFEKLLNLLLRYSIIKKKTFAKKANFPNDLSMRWGLPLEQFRPLNADHSPLDHRSLRTRSPGQNNRACS